MTYTLVRLDIAHQNLLDDLRRLRNDLMAYHGSYTSAEVFMTYVHKYLADDKLYILLARTAQDSVGFAMAHDVPEHPYMPEWTRAGYISQFFVAEAHRRNGVGDLLMANVDDWFAQRGLKRVLLNVDVENELGQHFWKRHNFRPYATRMRRES